MNFIYKYLILADRNHNILYGECIEWQLGKFDRATPAKATINLKKSYKAYIISSTSQLHSIIRNQITIKDKKELLFSFTENFTDFVTKKSSDKIFNPLTNLCSEIIFYTANNFTSLEFQEWSKANEALVNQIREKFQLDLIQHPELVKSFSFYKPTRLTASCKFLDKPENDDERLPTNISISLFDEFGLYHDAGYEITGHYEDSTCESHSGKLSNKTIDINFQQYPQELEIQISKDNKKIYHSKNSFIRSIKVSGVVSEGEITLENGMKVAKKFKSKISVD